MAGMVRKVEKTAEAAASPKQLVTGVVIFGSLVAAGFLAKGLKSLPGVSSVAMEAAGALVAVGGAVMMTQKGAVRSYGATVGATGIATVAAGLASRVGFPTSGEINVSTTPSADNGSGANTLDQDQTGTEGNDGLYLVA